jgi:hypothetical protein
MTGGTTSAEGLAGNNAGTGATLGCQAATIAIPRAAGASLGAVAGVWLEAVAEAWLGAGAEAVAGSGPGPPGLEDGLEPDLFRPSVERPNDDGLRPPEGTSERTMFRSAAEEALAVTSAAGRNT